MKLKVTIETECVFFIERDAANLLLIIAREFPMRDARDVRAILRQAERFLSLGQESMPPSRTAITVDGLPVSSEEPFHMPSEHSEETDLQNPSLGK